MAYIDRPSKELLTYYRGTVSALKVEQYDERDQIWFILDLTEETAALPPFGYTLPVGHEVHYLCIYRDIGTTVALAQLQLLRTALMERAEVGVWALRDLATTTQFVYSVCLYPG